ncbi:MULTISPECIES: hypothetical protein [Photorhabdus]|uniref:Lipoprotein n=1 Tax=Photorhabdus asymbiotica TaxID=291112 RepID=A0ABX9STH0_9GAMM|nr:hypothetical protein [Photorhabdus asymbiotica]RKS66807.1 hypothetical protein BDD30_1150 [Photorhabdus asymbiotica]
MNKLFIISLLVFIVTGCSTPKMNSSYISACGYSECNVKDIISGTRVKVNTTNSTPNFDKYTPIQDRQVIQSGGRPSFEKENYSVGMSFDF